MVWPALPTTLSTALHCVSQPRDLSSGAVTANLGSQSGVPNLFGLRAPVYAGTVPAVAANTVPTGVARARSAPAATIDKSGTENALRDQCLAKYEAGRFGFTCPKCHG